MYNKRFNYVLVGVFVTAMLVATVVSVAILTGRTGPTDRYNLVLDNVADIKFGSQVRYEGFPIGQVEDISAIDEGGRTRFQVALSVKQGWRIPDDSVARIASSSFLAAKTLDIAAGQSKQMLAPGDRIASGGPNDMFTTMSAAATKLTALSETSIKPLLETLQSLASTVDRDTPRITEKLVSFTTQLDALLGPVQRLLADENIAAVERTIHNTETMTSTLSQASQNLATAMARAQHLAANLDTLVETNSPDIDRTLQDLHYTLGSVARNIDTIVHNLDGTTRNMNEFSRLIRTNPGLLLGGSPREAVSVPQVSTRGKPQ